MTGTMQPIQSAAVAHDGKKTIAMLRRRPNESVGQLLTRLDEAIANAQPTGEPVDEINSKSSNETYKVTNPALGRIGAGRR